MPGARARVPATARGPKRLLSPLRPTARLSERGRCGGRRQPCGQRGGRRGEAWGGGGGRCRGRAATAFAFAFPSAGPFWFPAAFPRSHVVRLFPPRRSPSRRRPRACALRPAGVGGAQPGGGPRTHPRAGLWGRVGERGSQSLTREVGGEVRQLAPKESGGSGTAVQ